MSVDPTVVIVAPGDDPPQIQGSPQLARLERYGRVIVHTEATKRAVVDRGLFRPGSLRAKALRRLDRKIAERADLALVDTPHTAEYLHEIAGLALERWRALPVGSELPRQAFPEPQPGGALRALFVGTGVPLHGTEVILRAVALLEREGTPFEMRFVGGTRADRRLATELGLRTVTFVDRFAGPLELGRHHARCELVLGVFGTGSKAARVVPCKIYDALASSRAVVTGDTPAVRDLLFDCPAVRTVPVGDPQALAGSYWPGSGLY